MSSFNLTSSVFPQGTSVGAYPKSQWPAYAPPPSGAPPGSPTESATVDANGLAAFSALAAETDYFFAAQVASVWRYVSGSTRSASTSATQAALAQEISDRQTGDAANVAKSLADAKGDLLVATADNTIARVAVGANGRGLVADSAQASGVGWTDVATQAELDAEAASRATGDTTETANTQTGDYTLVLTDAGKCVEINSASAQVVTVPTNASVAFPVGTVLEVCRFGAGTVTIAAAGGVTIRSKGGLLAIADQYASVALRKRATNEWVLVGDLGA